MSQLMEMLDSVNYPPINNFRALKGNVDDNPATMVSGYNEPDLDDSWAEDDCVPDCDLERVVPPRGFHGEFKALEDRISEENMFGGQFQDRQMPEEPQIPITMNEETLRIKYTLKTYMADNSRFNPNMLFAANNQPNPDLVQPPPKVVSLILTVTMDPVNFGPIAQPDNNRIEETIAIIDETTELRQGCCKTFVNGKMHKSGFYVNDVKEGDFVYGWQRKPVTTKVYKAGTLTRVTDHCDNSTVDYQPGSNLTTRYHPDGSIACTFTHIFDNTPADADLTKDKMRGTLKHGVEEHRDPAGNITLQVSWDHGLRHGVSRSFKDGEPNGHETYDRGVLHGESMSYHPNGTIDTESYYVAGRLHGPFKSHYPNGNLKSFGTYNDGHQHDMLHYYENGAVQAIIRTNAAGYTSSKTFYPTGEPLITEQYLNHLLDGPRTVYHANGKPSIESHYVKGKKHGSYKIFSETDILRETTTYDNNMPVGERKVFHPDGSPKVVEHYVDGKLHGLRETFGYGVLMTSTMFEQGFQVKKE